MSDEMSPEEQDAMLEQYWRFDPPIAEVFERAWVAGREYGERGLELACDDAGATERRVFELEGRLKVADEIAEAAVKRVRDELAKVEAHEKANDKDSEYWHTNYTESQNALYSAEADSRHCRDALNEVLAWLDDETGDLDDEVVDRWRRVVGQNVDTAEGDVDDSSRSEVPLWHDPLADFTTQSRVDSFRKAYWQRGER